MITVPQDFAVATYEAMPLPNVGEPQDAWTFIQAVSEAAQANTQPFLDLQAEQGAFSENQRMFDQMYDRQLLEVVKNYQRQRDLMPNFTDYETMMQQYNWLVASL